MRGWCLLAVTQLWQKLASFIINVEMEVHTSPSPAASSHLLLLTEAQQDLRWRITSLFFGVC